MGKPEALKIKRDLVKARVERVMKVLEKHPTTATTLGYAEEALEIFEREREKFETVQAEILAAVKDDPDKVAAEELIGDSYETMLINAKAKARDIKIQLTPAPAINPNANQPQPSIKLPTIELPTFDGKFENWKAFQDLFTATVDGNANLSSGQKMQYLLSSLHGDAANLVKSLTISDANYRTAWKIITERYDHQFELVMSNLSRLFDQPIMQVESASGLRQLLDTTMECRRALDTLGRNVSDWDDIFVHLLLKRLDQETRRRWVTSLVNKDVPSYSNMNKFLDRYVRGLECEGTSSSSSSSSHSNSGTRPSSANHHPRHNQFNNNAAGRKVKAHHGSSSYSRCPACKGSHLLFKCEKFLAMAPGQRGQVIKEASLCFNCFKPGHSSLHCSNEHKCKKCGRSHHTLLHRDPEKPVTTTNTEEPPATKMSNYGAAAGSQQVQVLLATAVVNIKDASGAFQECRVLLDGGSEASFISEHCVSRLGLQRVKSNVVIKGIGNTVATPARGEVRLTMTSRVNSYSLQVSTFILPRVTGILPSTPCTVTDWTHLHGLELADPHYFKPRHVDVLLGADYMATVMADGRRVGPPNSPVAMNTRFGWVLMGRITTGSSKQFMVNHCQIDQILQKFWHIEEMPKVKHLTKEEEECEQHFKATVSRNQEGRYVVQLPTKSNITQLGESKSSAVKKFHQVERRLAMNPERKQQYSKFMQEFLDLDHMEPVQEESARIQTYYLPHHFVVKESSTTTKLRVVFDGSAKSSSGLSLNDCLMVGPTVQDDLYKQLLKFRLSSVALKADITKMYRQFEVADCHKDLQRFIWRFNEHEPLQTYRIKRVTYGTASAPYLATRCLNQLAEDEKQRFPAAATALIQDFYVDDLMTGRDTPSEAIALQQQLASLLKSGGMGICKWASNSEEVMAAVPEESRESLESLSLDNEHTGTIKALGVCWHPGTDTFSFQGYIMDDHNKMTKRAMLSELARVYDPLGLLSPFTVRAKIMFQELWKLKIDWDTEVPADIQQQWTAYKEDLKIISEIRIPRCITTTTSTIRQLHGFCDGSELAYGAMVYMRSEQVDGSVVVRLITSKSKVAPLKKISVPRLELCSAQMLASLITQVKEALSLEADVDIYTWGDSSTVLKWLAACPSRWKTFVANRVTEIQDLVASEKWRYVKTHENPADLLTRGISATELKESSLWWHGPPWLSTHQFPVYSYDTKKEDIENEQRALKVLKAEVVPQLILWNKYSTYNKVIRITAWILRYVKNLKSKNRQQGPLTTHELQESLLVTVRQIQQQEDLEQLVKHQQVKRNSKLYTLAPFVDHKGVLRVGGRLQNAKLPEEVKHPCLLPHRHPFVTLIIRHFHFRHLHGGSKLVHAAIQQQFWILRAKDAIQLVVRRCVTCRRHKAATALQFMGNLPSARVNPGFVFQQCGTDFAGPFLLRDRGRGKVSFKYYVCIFICMSTKAVHLEPVTGLSTEAFLATFKRFVARRGLPTDVYSDCGTNYVGADKELQELFKLCNQNDIIINHLAEMRVKWHFNPPGAPHQGGLWEAAVKSMKFHLKRVIGATTVTSEEFSTLLCQIEASLNSRPICSLSSDPSDFQPLTPGHFLIGRPLTAVPEPDVTTIQVSRLSRWQLVQQMTQHFWKRWSTEYLTTLQQRFRWAEKHRNLEVGDLVLVRDENQPPTNWSMGRIAATHPGADGLVRCATVKTASSEFKRPTTKLCLLLDPDDETLQQSTATNS